MNAFISAASGAVPTNPPSTRPPSTFSRSSVFGVRVGFSAALTPVGDQPVDARCGSAGTACRPPAAPAPARWAAPAPSPRTASTDRFRERNSLCRLLETTTPTGMRPPRWFSGMKLTLTTGTSAVGDDVAGPQRAQHALGPHRALGRAGAARGVEDHRQALVVGAGVSRVGTGSVRAARDDVGQSLDRHCSLGDSRIRACSSASRCVVDVRVVVEHRPHGAPTGCPARTRPPGQGRRR